MCGVAGIFSCDSSGDSFVDEEELKTIRDHMRSRGPDMKGIWLSDDRKIGLAHRRLSIIDLSDRGYQPMRDNINGNIIVFNGEIYNFKNIRDELKQIGYKFESDTDTELLLKLYSHSGKGMLKKIRGMYSFAIYDNKEKKLFLARDPLGIKPLYFSFQNNIFRFASQVKALIQSKNISREKEKAGHVGYFLWGYVPEPFTLYKEIRSLEAGHFIEIYKNSEIIMEKFDGLDVRFSNIQTCIKESNPSHLEKISNYIQETIDSHLLSDVPIASFLSSGIDSAIISHYASNELDLNTITLGYDEYINTNNDEVPLAEYLSEVFKSNHETCYIKLNNFLEDKEQIIKYMDQPTIDGINTWFVAKETSRRGNKVALSGLGGDEIFASYPSFKNVPLISDLNMKIPFSKQIGKILRKTLNQYSGYLKSPKYLSLFEYGDSLGAAYLLQRALFLPWEIEKILGKEFTEIGLNRLDPINKLNKSISSVNQPRLALSTLEINNYMKNQLLRDSDWAGMAHSLEIRVPFADIEFLTYMAQILANKPSLSKENIARHILSEKVKEDFFTRKKSGFSIPITNWSQRTNNRKSNSIRNWALELYNLFTC